MTAGPPAAPSSPAFCLMRAEGASMWPAILDGDTLLLDCRARQPAVGEVWVVAVQGAKIAHRVAFVESWGGELRVRCKGDGAGWDPWVSGADLVGKVVAVSRGRRFVNAGRRWWHPVVRWLVCKAGLAALVHRPGAR